MSIFPFIVIGYPILPFFNQMKISERHFFLIQAYVEKVVYAESNENLEWSLWRQRIGSGLTPTRGERKRVQSRLELM